MRRGAHTFRPVDPDVQLSKTMSYLLRHSGPEEGLTIRSDGFVEVKSLMNTKTMKLRRSTVEDILRVVENDQKQRYTIKKCPETNEILIRANQGHSKVEAHDLELKKIEDPSEIPVVVHGTFFRFWDNIKKSGLSKMKRQHIHFGASETLQQGSGGLRENSQIIIYIDTAKAMKDGIEFYKSANNVILSPGNADGVISKDYFAKALNTKTKMELKF